MMTSISALSGFSVLSQLAELRNAWEQEYSKRAEGGILALSGFEHQFLLTLLKMVYLWKEATNAERQDFGTAQKVLAEAISDITESGRAIRFTQVKRTLSASGLRSALEELWEIFMLASERTPDLARHLQFVISGQFEGDEDPQKVIQGWRTRSKEFDQQELGLFKRRVSYELVPDPRADLSSELQILARNEDTNTTVARWLGYLLQLGSGYSPESISILIWKELINDGSMEAFRVTLARLFSLSHSRLCAVRETLGERITLPRNKLSDLRVSVLEAKITFLVGPSGSGKSALCKVGIQQDFKQDFDCLFLNASDVASFTESSDVIANRGLRRLDELLAARITQKPTLVIIDDLSDVGDRDFEAVLNLLQNTLTADTSSGVRFVFIAHVEAKHRIHEKISARLGNNLVCADVELPQLPIEELLSSEDLPNGITSLIRRHHEFGPALNLKLVDWLVRNDQSNQIDASAFKNDLDLLTWFWHDYVQDGQSFSDLGQGLIEIAEELANRFTPDLPYDLYSSIENKVLRTLVRRDCLRLTDEGLAVTHRFVGDCARFYNLRGNRREIESKHLVERLKNPFWVQPVRWFALQLALKSEESETWQELICEALKGEYLQLLDLLLDGAILSKQPGSVLHGFPDESLPFVIERLITRLLAIATETYSFHSDGSQSTPLRTHIVIQEQITGIPKADLWEPVWRWLLLQSPETLIGESCVVFRAAEAWLNWSVHAQSFSLRSEVANLTLDLAQTVLLPDPNPEHTWETRYRLGDFESNAFACIVFSLRITPERSAWFLKALAGREIVSANRLKPRQEITGTTPCDEMWRMLHGNGVLQPGHPNGPRAEVNRQFRQFMLKWNGLYLNAVIRANPQLGVELFLALTIQPPHYRYETERRNYSVLDRDRGTAGSDDIDVCTFKFLPLLSLLQSDEGAAISIVEILCKIATRRSCEIDEYLKQERGGSEGNPEIEKTLSSLRTDTHELTLFVGNTGKQFQGGRKALYWHRNNLAPPILACLLMTLEGWLYSRPTKQELEHSISLILERTSTVAMLGVLVSLAKCDPRLLSEPLLPLISSLQLLVWLESEQIDHGQEFGFDAMEAEANLSPEDYQELLKFNRLSYRHKDLQAVICRLWVDGVIPSVEQSQILRNWDEQQLGLIPEISKNKALKIRSLFERRNWQEENDSKGEKTFKFVGTIPGDPKEEAESKASLWNFHHLQIVVTCRQILDGRREKTIELHSQLVNLLTSQEQINLFKENLKPKAFTSAIWAAIAIVLEPPSDILSKELKTDLNYLATTLPNLPISLYSSQRCQSEDLLDTGAFIAHVAPRLLRELQSDNSIRESAFRCLIGVQNCHTSVFMRSWIKEYGLENPLTQQLINVAPWIARLISLTDAFICIKQMQINARSEESHIFPRPKEIDCTINKQEEPQIKEVWLSFQNDFVDGKLRKVAIFDVLEWIPEVLIQPIADSSQKRLILHSFDWEFLTAVLVPILELTVEGESEEFQRSLVSLREQVIFAFLHERENVYEEDEYSDGDIYLHNTQLKLLDAVIRPNNTNSLVEIDKLLHALRDFNLIDCILLGHIIGASRRNIAGSDTLDVNNVSSRSEIALEIGDYLLEFRSQPDSDLRILGEISAVWENLIELLAQELSVKLLGQESGFAEGIALADRSLVDFFNRFREILFPHWLLRRKLCAVATLSGYKLFRRSIFKALVQQQEFLPSSRNDESETLVQVLAELWDSDCTWIISKQSRCQDLRILLGRLQEIDAAGARNLADQVANFLAS
jgi:hypothetical protein